MVYIIDTQTGNSYLKGTSEAQGLDRDEDGGPSSTARRTMVDTRWLKKAKDPSMESPPQWLQDALKVRLFRRHPFRETYKAR